MQKENRNNRVHTGEQSGKTDFLIERLLPVGKENAITTQDLVKLSGCGSARELQQRIQLLRSDIHYQSRANEVGAISKAIKALAMELNIPIIALSQLNRVSEMRQDKVPTMGELREAGDIEQDASIILLMWNIVDDKKGLKVEKNRQGILSTEVLRFDGDNMQFIETDESIKEAAKGFRKAEEPTPFD